MSAQFTPRPAFDLHRFKSTFLLAMNPQMAKEVYSILDEFNDLDQHLVALRDKLGTCLAYWEKERQERQVA
jgi:hypothetical protein